MRGGYTRDMHVAPPTSPLVRHGHVVVVEDDATQRMTYAAMAGRTGLEVHDFADADSARTHISRAGAGEVALAVVDIDLGASSGLDLLRWLRDQPHLATVPVILLTGHDDVDARVSGLAAGANDYIGKPVHPRELRARIDAHLRTTGSWDQRLKADLHRRVELADEVAGIVATTPTRDLCGALEAALARQPGVMAATIMPLVGGAPVGAVGRSWTAAGLSMQATLSAGGAHSGPWVHRDEPGGVVAACVPLMDRGQPVGLLVLEHDGLGVVSAARLLAAAIDAGAALAPVMVDRVLGPTAHAAVHEQVRRIIDRQAFTVVYQPIVDLASGRVVGFEGLTRFPEQRPDLVFADAARAGLSGELHRVTAAALLAGARTLPDACYLSVNASPQALVDGALEGLAGAPRPLVVEVTEHEEVADHGAVRAAVSSLGPEVRLAVDDAGAGYASLAHILRLAPDIIKLDRSIVTGLHDSPGQEAMVAGLVHFGERTGARLVAEGIESAGEVAVCRALGVHLGQGYHLGRPAAADALADGR